MATLKQLQWIRKIPTIGGRLYDFGKSIQDSLTAIEQQGNFNTTGAPAPPPNIQAVTAVTNDNGVITFSVHDQSEINRGTEYTIEHADNPSFVNPQIRHLGPSRSHSEFVGNQTRFVRALSNHAASGPSALVYHGSAVAPIPVNAGGSIPAVVYPPSQGSGTSAPGQGGYGQGPVQSRRARSSFDWTAQQPPTQSTVATVAGLPATSTPAGSAAITDGTGGKGSGSGGGSTPLPPASATILGSNSSGGFIAAALAAAKIFIGSAGSLPVAQSISGDATLTAGGALTLATVNANVGTFGDATHVSQVAVNGKGQVTAAASVAITFPASLPPSGPAGGGLAGTYPNPTIALISGAVITPVLIAALPGTPSPGQVASVSNASGPAIGSPVAGTGTAFAAVMWNGSQWTVFSI